MNQAAGRIGIIGAGITGLVAARRLAAKGRRVTVLEAGREIGGLAGTFTLTNGTHLERAYHFLYPTDTHTIRLAEELDIRDAISFHPSSIGAFYRGRLHPFLTAGDLLRFPALGWSAKVRTGLVALYLRRLRGWQKLTEVTAMDWLNRHNGRKATETLWKPLLKGKFDKYYDKVTMAWLWGRVRQRQESRDAGAGQERLGYFAGGFRTLLAALERELAALGVAVLKETPVARIDPGPDGELVLRAGMLDLACDAVLATVPSPVFAGLIDGMSAADAEYKAKLRGIEYLDAVTMVLVTPQKLSDYYWHQFHDVDAPFLVALRLTALTEDTRPFDGNHVYYLGDYLPPDSPLLQRSDDDIRERWLKHLQALFGDFDPGRIVESHVFRFRNAQHVVDVGYETRKLVDLRTPVGGVYLANFSRIFPQDRGVNYAVRDGEAAADAIDADLRGRLGSS